MFDRRISFLKLGKLCDRVATAFDVGHDPHTIFQREADTGKFAYARRMQRIANHVEAGGTLTDAVNSEGNYFPNEFVQMVHVGEATGKLERVLQYLAEYYDDLATLKREFVNSLMWPLVQLAIGLIAVGILIYVPGAISQDQTEPLDILGVGLVGLPGLLKYLSILVVILIALLVAYALLRLGFFNRFRELSSRLPVIGPTINILAETRFVQTLALAFGSGLDVWNSVELAFASADNPLFENKAESASRAVRQGRELHVVLAETGVLSRDTISACRLGEETGRLAETLEKHFNFLTSEAKTVLKRIGFVASTIIWILISSLLILVIFRVFSVYLANIEATGEGLINRVTPQQPFDE